MRWPTANLRRHGLSAWRAVEAGVDAAFGAQLNPLRHLGAIGFLAFWLLASSGVLLYVMLDTSVSGAYRSIEALAHTPLGWGRLLRGVHRYAADGLVLVLGLHLLREWLHGHERGFRRFHWLTGVPLIGFVFVSAVGGFWINWDALGQFSAIATSEWLDALPFLATPLARNFLAAGAVSDRLFSLFIFVHIGVALLLLFGLWFHVQRIARAAVLPPRAVTLSLTGILVLLALMVPVISHPPATQAHVPEVLRLDWILLFAHPLADATSPGVLWAGVLAGALLLVAAPFLPQPPRPEVAVVDAAHCNGCQRCLADCPYSAITMVPHPHQRIARTLAVVDADLCAGCGICAGACPSSTPFRGAALLATGIDLPQRTVSDLRSRLQEALASVRGKPPVVVFRCDHGAVVADAAGVRTFGLLCAGQLPPSFIEYALREGAAGVVVAACREGGCEFRFGERWTAERLAGTREPHLRSNVSHEQLELVFAGAGDETRLRAAIQRLRHA